MNQDGVDVYKVNQVMGASPGQLVLLLYDHVIKCTKSSDVSGASKGIVELMSSLDLDYQEISGRLFSLYEYCLDLVKKRRFDEATKIMTEMRQMWAVAMEQMGSQGTPPSGSTKENVDVVY
ncbi:MAG TPA: flagellar export chaperone FliS [bacterium]|nr:flagellar export chaperone FliS [bacterium]